MYVLSKPKSSKPPAQTKLCLHCNQTKPLSNFYANRNWIDNGGKDAWCKQCIAKIRTKDEMRKYFWENNREWKENVWENALKQAEIQASKSTVYQKSNEDRRQVLLESIACPIIPSLMQKQQNYKYEDHTNNTLVNNYEQAKENGQIIVADTKLPNFRFLKLEDIKDSLPLIDYITPNEDEARYFSGKEDPEEMADVFLGFGIKNVIIKLGGKGCFFKNEKESFLLPPCNIIAVDATGAGDNFVAGFTSEILRGASNKDALRFANACGAICTTAVGAATALKSREQVVEFLS